MGHLECLKYALHLSQRERREREERRERIIIQCCYRYAHEKKCPWQVKKKLYGYKKKYKLLVDKVGSIYVPVALGACGNAAYGGHLECLRYCASERRGERA
jgi:hypothetical protein